MKQHLDRVLSLRSGVALATVGLALTSAVLAGCASATIDGAVPTASSAAQMPAPAETTAQAVTPGDPAAVSAMPTDAPRKTGTFPNLNIKPQVASEQISPEEKQTQIEALTSAQKQHAAAAAAAPGTTDPVLLRKLAAAHANDALKEIEAQK